MATSSAPESPRIAMGFAARATLAVAALMATASGVSANSAGDTLWLAESDSILELSASGGDLLLSLLADSPVRSVAVDASGARVWFYTDGTLHAVSLDGVPLFSQPIPAPAGSSAAIDVDLVEGTVWLGVGSGLWRYSPAGVEIATATLSSAVRELEIDVARQILWAATETGLEVLDLVSGFPVDWWFSMPGPAVVDVDLAPATGDLYLLSNGSLQRWLAFPDQRMVAVYFQLPAPDGQLVAAREDGTYLATSDSLYRVSDQGTVLWSLTPFPAGVVTALSTDGSDGSAWITTSSQIAQVSPEGLVVQIFSLPTASEIRDMDLFVDLVPPQVRILAPQPGELINRKRPVFVLELVDVGSGVDLSSISIEVNSTPAGASCSAVSVGAECTLATDLPEGEVSAVVTAKDHSGNAATPTLVTFVIDTEPPEPLDATLIQLEVTSAALVTLIGSPGSSSVETARIEATNTGTAMSTSTAPDTAGGFTLQIQAAAAELIEMRAVDAAGNASSPVSLTVPGGSNTPSDPSTTAPPNDPTVATNLAASTAFLYTGPNPVQTGVEQGVIETERAGVLRGRVLSAAGVPLAGVQVTIHDRPEYGTTGSRADGLFDLAVNGGEELTVSYQKAGFLPVHRKVQPTWRAFTWVDDVLMVAIDPSVTTVVSLAASVQVAAGSAVADLDGERRAVVLFPPGTGATLVMPDGSSQPAGTLSIRATEYTAGTSGRTAMPAPLPASSGFTYAVELSADEALAAGATRVELSRDVYLYVDNFLNFPTGEPVPTGYYDRILGSWIPADDGRVIRLIGISNGRAILDLDGSGSAANPEALTALGFGDEELAQLPHLFSLNESFWRTPIPHFTPWDLNFPYGPPEDATQPPAPNEPVDDESDPNDDPGPLEQDPCLQNGSIVECENQVLGETILLAGDSVALNYRSNRVPGFEASRTVKVRLSEAAVPASLIRIDLSIVVAGQRMQQSFPPLPNQYTTFTWNGLDAYGRPVVGSETALIEVAYVYPLVYYSSRADRPRIFGSFSTSLEPIGISLRENAEIWKRVTTTLTAAPPQGYGLGGWTLTPHHRFDPEHKVLLRGDGTEQRYEDASLAASTWTLSDLSGHVETAGDGSVYFVRGIFCISCPNRYTLIRREPSGQETALLHTDDQFGGNPRFAVRGDGHYAYIWGQCFTSTGPAFTVVHVNDEQQVVQRFLGEALGCPYVLAWGPDGSLFAGTHIPQPSHPPRYQILRLWPDGSISLVAGTTNLTGSDEGSALNAVLSFDSLAVDDMGRILFNDANTHQVRRIDVDGRIAVVAGNGMSGFSGDGGAATAARLEAPGTIRVGAEGVAINDAGKRIRLVRKDGTIVTIAGGGTVPVSTQPLPPTQAMLASGDFTRIRGLARYPNGAFAAIHVNNHLGSQSRMLRLDPAAPVRKHVSNLLVASADRPEVYEFDSSGRHLRTLDEVTGRPLLSFGYDDLGRLVEISNNAGPETSITYDGTGAATITPSSGAPTRVEFDGDGLLARAIDPLGNSILLSYSNGGLLTSKLEPDGDLHRFSYSNAGRLRRDEHPAGGFLELNRERVEGGHRVTLTSASGPTRTFGVSRTALGEENRSMSIDAGPASTARLLPQGQRVRTYPDGTTVSTGLSPDSRWGRQASRTSSLQISIPSGPSYVSSHGRTVALATSQDVLGTTTVDEFSIVNGRTFSRRYEAATNTVTTTTAQGRSQRLSLDESSRPSAVSLGHFEPTRFEYDVSGRLDRVSRGTGVDERVFDFEYDSRGFLIYLQDPLLQTWQFEWDAAGRQTGQIRPDGSRVEFAYDPDGDLIQVTPFTRAPHAYVYGAGDLLREYQPPLVGEVASAVQYTYDPNRRLVRVETSDGRSLQIGYDPTGGPKTLSHPDDNVTTIYDPGTGRVSSVMTNDTQISYTYIGPLLSGTSWTGAIQGNVSRTYDNNFWLRSMTVSGFPISFDYDNDGLLTQAGELAISRDAASGRVLGTILGNVQTEAGYNSFGELETETTSIAGVSTLAVSYTRDRLGRIVTRTQSKAGANTIQEYEYDAGGRLTEVKRQNTPIETYQYDGNSNRTSAIYPWGIRQATLDAQDRLTSYGTSNFTYQSTGELLTETDNGATTTYHYDLLGNLRRVLLPSGEDVEYVIDGLNRRVGRRINGVLVQGYLYSNKLNIVAELDSTGSVVSRFVYGTRTNVPDYMIRGSQVFRLISDHLGSIDLVIDAATGEVVQEIEYDTFGRTIADTNPGFQPFGFAGGLYDPLTGLVRFGARDYNPQTGRWTAKDPILFAGKSPNLYVYSEMDPVNLQDPLGNDPVPLGTTTELMAFLATRIAEIATEATEDFLRNFGDMKRSNTIGADKYFHCKANCEAAQRGPVGEATALAISYAREAVDYPKNIVKEGLSPTESFVDCYTDELANRTGRDALPTDSCIDRCRSFRPPGLPAIF